MAGSVIVSDDFWLLGPRFARYIDTDLVPDIEDVESVKPELSAVANLKPQMGTVTKDTEPSEYRPRTGGASILRPAAIASNMKPRIKRVTEE